MRTSHRDASETATVLNSIGVPPASRTPRLTSTARSRWLRLHGMVSIHVVPTPTIGFARSSSVKPVAFNIERAPARSGPSVSAALCRLAGSDGRSYGVVTEFLSRWGSFPAAPLAERTRVETDVLAAGKHQPLGYDTGGHAGAAVGDVLALRRPGGERVGGRGHWRRRESAPRPGRAAPPRRASVTRLRASRSSQGWSPSRARISSAVIVSSSRGRAWNLGRCRRDGLHRRRPDVAAHVDRAGRVVTEVPQQPPATGGPAGAVVEREDEVARSDPGASRRPRFSCAIIGEWMAATVCRIGADRREVGLGIEVDGTGNVPRLVVPPSAGRRRARR